MRPATPTDNEKAANILKALEPLKDLVRPSFFLTERQKIHAAFRLGEASTNPNNPKSSEAEIEKEVGHLYGGIRAGGMAYWPRDRLGEILGSPNLPGDGDTEFNMQKRTL